tara:strand:- start:987 stop:3506 length:2520 start_codon:yes stop_codon:yes gene_type:complete
MSYAYLTSTSTSTSAAILTALLSFYLQPIDAIHVQSSLSAAHDHGSDHDHDPGSSASASHSASASVSTSAADADAGASIAVNAESAAEPEHDVHVPAAKRRRADSNAAAGESENSNNQQQQQGSTSYEEQAAACSASQQLTEAEIAHLTIEYKHAHSKRREHEQRIIEEAAPKLSQAILTAPNEHEAFQQVHKLLNQLPSEKAVHALLSQQGSGFHYFNSWHTEFRNPVPLAASRKFYKLTKWFLKQGARVHARFWDANRQMSYHSNDPNPFEREHDKALSWNVYVGDLNIDPLYPACAFEGFDRNPDVSSVHPFHMMTLVEILIVQGDEKAFVDMMRYIIELKEKGRLRGKLFRLVGDYSQYRISEASFTELCRQRGKRLNSERMPGNWINDPDSYVVEYNNITLCLRQGWVDAAVSLVQLGGLVPMERRTNTDRGMKIRDLGLSVLVEDEEVLSRWNDVIERRLKPLERAVVEGDVETIQRLFTENEKDSYPIMCESLLQTAGLRLGGDFDDKLNSVRPRKRFEYEWWALNGLWLRDGREALAEDGGPEAECCTTWLPRSIRLRTAQLLLKYGTLNGPPTGLRPRAGAYGVRSMEASESDGAEDACDVGIRYGLVSSLLLSTGCRADLCLMSRRFQDVQDFWKSAKIMHPASTARFSDDFMRIFFGCVEVKSQFERYRIAQQENRQGYADAFRQFGRDVIENAYGCGSVDEMMQKEFFYFYNHMCNMPPHTGACPDASWSHDGYHYGLVRNDRLRDLILNEKSKALNLNSENEFEHPNILSAFFGSDLPGFVRLRFFSRPELDPPTFGGCYAAVVFQAARYLGVVKDRLMRAKALAA